MNLFWVTGGFRFSVFPFWSFITPEVQEIMKNTFHSFNSKTAAALVSAHLHACFAVLFPGLSCYRTDSLVLMQWPCKLSVLWRFWFGAFQGDDHVTGGLRAEDESGHREERLPRERAGREGEPVRVRPETEGRSQRCSEIFFFGSFVRVCFCSSSSFLCVSAQTWGRSSPCSKNSRYRRGNRPSAVQPKSLLHQRRPPRLGCPPLLSPR